jgi:Aromatic-ring-opening dioxygenase LigAB, LigA subunit
MSRYQVDKLLRDLNRDRELAARWQGDVQSVLGGYDLSAAEREALERLDVRRLYDMGVNPLLLLLSSFAAGKGIAGYCAAMKDS